MEIRTSSLGETKSFLTGTWIHTVVVLSFTYIPHLIGLLPNGKALNDLPQNENLTYANESNVKDYQVT